MSSTSGQEGRGTLPLYYRMGELYYKCKGGYVEIEKINQNEIHHIQNSPLTAPNLKRPVYVRTSGAVPDDSSGTGQNPTFAFDGALSRSIQIYPTSITSNVKCNYIALPTTVSWGYTINSSNGKTLYNANTAVHFDLHRSEETELVIKILELAGIQIKDPQLYQQAATEEGQNIQQES